MNLKKLFAAMAGVSAAVLLAGTATAQCTFTAQASGAWSNPSTWSVTGGGGCPTYPGASDYAIIPNGRVVDVTGSETVKQLTINQGGTVHINGGNLTMAANSNGATISGLLEITGNYFATASSGSAVTVTSTGQILMDGTAPSLMLNFADAVILDSGALITVDPTVSGSPAQGFAYFGTSGAGSLRSDDSANEIQLNTGQTGEVVLEVSSGVELHGAMTLKRQSLTSGHNATLSNQGRFRADKSGDAIVIQDLTEVVDVASASCDNAGWQAGGGASTSYLQFVNVFPSSPFEAGLRVRTNGRVDFLDGAGSTIIYTNGDIKMESGSVIYADPGSFFQFNAPCGGTGATPTNPLADDIYSY